jgi:ribosomal protein S18 acetylase RimI-like enzyme
MNNEQEAQIRYMGVSFNVRRMGIGTSIVEKLEEKARALGATYVALNARNVALNFYKSLGYVEIESYESDIKIPHTRMEKRLS